MYMYVFGTVSDVRLSNLMYPFLKVDDLLCLTETNRPMRNFRLICSSNPAGEKYVSFLRGAESGTREIDEQFNAAEAKTLKMINTKLNLLVCILYRPLSNMTAHDWISRPSDCPGFEISSHSELNPVLAEC